MRRRREDELKDVIGAELKTQAKGLLGLIVGLVFKQLINLVLNALKKIDWIDLSDPYETENPA